MKMNHRNLRICMVGLCFFFVIGLSSASAFSTSTVYDNSDSIYGCGGWNVFYNGNQITLNGTDRTITDFTFYYTVESGPSDASVRIYFLANDGETGAPESVLFDSGEISISGSEGDYSCTISNINTLVPDSFTWAIGFNISSYDPASVQTNSTWTNENPLIAFPQTTSDITVGEWNCTWYYESYLDKWIKSTVPEGFSPCIYAATIKATTVPVPGSFCLLVSSLVCIARIKRRRGEYGVSTV